MGNNGIGARGDAGGAGSSAVSSVVEEKSGTSGSGTAVTKQPIRALDKDLGCPIRPFTPGEEVVRKVSAEASKSVASTVRVDSGTSATSSTRSEINRKQNDAVGGGGAKAAGDITRNNAAEEERPEQSVASPIPRVDSAGATSATSSTTRSEINSKQADTVGGGGAKAAGDITRNNAAEEERPEQSVASPIPRVDSGTTSATTSSSTTRSEINSKQTDTVGGGGAQATQDTMRNNAAEEERPEQNGHSGVGKSTREINGQTPAALLINGERRENNDDKQIVADTVIGKVSAGESDVDNVEHPYVGKRVRIKDGQHKGLTGKVLQIKSRSWWTIDHPDLIHRKIHSLSCELMDEVGEEELRKYYAKLQKKMRSGSPAGSMSNSLFGEAFGEQKKDEIGRSSGSSGRSRSEEDGSKKLQSAAGVLAGRAGPPQSSRVTVGESSLQPSSGTVAQHTATRNTDPRENLVKASSWTTQPKDTPGGDADNTGADAPHSYPPDSSKHSIQCSSDQPSKKRRLSTNSSPEESTADQPEATVFDDEHAVDSGDRMLASQLDMNMSTVDDSFASTPSQLQCREGGHTYVPTLPPVLFDAQQRAKLPASLAHLPRNLKLDIFNRRTGRIMTGDDAVRVKDIPELLQMHAEYEPVIPPPQQEGDDPDTPSRSVREGRSSENVRVGHNVTSQIRIDLSSYEGKSVIVTEGPYRGLVGEVDACLPGGWYLVSGIFAQDDVELQIAISPQNIRLLPGSETTDDQRSRERTSDVVVNQVGVETTNGQRPIERTSDMVVNAVGSTVRNGKDFVKDFQGYMNNHFSVPIRSLKMRVEALKDEKKSLQDQLVQQPPHGSLSDNGPSSKDLIGMRLQQVQSNLTKAESDLRENLKSVAAARLHVAQCFDQLESAGK